jgi:hypothetical protein
MSRPEPWKDPYSARLDGCRSLAGSRECECCALAHTEAVTFLNGEVVGLDLGDSSGRPVAALKVVMANQGSVVMASGTTEIVPPNP